VVVLDLTRRTVSSWMSTSNSHQHILCSTKNIYSLKAWDRVVLPSRQWEKYPHSRAIPSTLKFASVPQIFAHIGKCFVLRFRNLSIISIPPVAEHFIIIMPVFAKSSKIFLFVFFVRLTSSGVLLYTSEDGVMLGTGYFSHEIWKVRRQPTVKTLARRPAVAVPALNVARKEPKGSRTALWLAYLLVKCQYIARI